MIENLDSMRDSLNVTPDPLSDMLKLKLIDVVAVGSSPTLTLLLAKPTRG
jgi:hypothetical protein